MSFPSQNAKALGFPHPALSYEAAKKGMQEFRKIAISAEAIARSIMLAISQPDDADINEIIVRPTASPY